MSGPYPLPVSSFEFAMLVDDRPTHPMTFGVRLSFDRPLDWTAFFAALRDTVHHHPRLVGRVEGLGAKRPAGARWQANTGDLVYERGPLPEQPRSIDLRQGPGVRLTVSGESTAMLEFHHACIDGLGVVRVLEELFGRATQSKSHGEHRGISYLFALRRIASFFRSRPRPLIVPSDPVGGPAWHWATLSADETVALFTTARHHGVTVNDIIVREVFLTLEEWNAILGRPGGVHRICVPMSTRSGNTTDSANGVTMVTLDRIVRRASPAELLRSVAKEMADVRRERRTHPALMVLDALAHVPGGIAAVYAPNRCQATAVASNLGVIFSGSGVQFGDAVLQDIHFLPPVRPLTRTAIAVSTYAGCLSIGATTDPTALSSTNGRCLFNGFLGRLRAFKSGRAL